MALGEGELATLQERAYRGVVDGELPDGTSVPRFPDLAYVLQAEEQLVSTRHLARPFEGPDRILSPEEITALAAERGEVPYLEFRMPEFADDVVRMAVDVCLGFADVDPLRLGAITFAFRRDATGGWSTAEPPRALAY